MKTQLPFARADSPVHSPAAATPIISWSRWISSWGCAMIILMVGGGRRAAGHLVMVTGMVEKLFDEDHQEAFGFPAPGQSFFIGVELTLQTKAGNPGRAPLSCSGGGSVKTTLLRNPHGKE